jgi:anthranilate phosphoribosyltransferase
MRSALAKLAGGSDLEPAEAEEAVRAIMAGEATPAQIGAFLALLRRKGETAEEILGAARAMRAAMTPVRSRHPLVADTCGTGGDGAGTFNISTAAAFVVAGAGVPVAKHGNRAASSRAGSADVVEALGVRVDLPPQELGRCLDELGIAFLFAQAHHGAMRHAAAPRRELGFRTIFNLIGPLANPAGAHVQVVGVPEADLVAKMAAALRALGSRRALVVHGGDGLDEFTLDGPSLVADTAEPGAICVREVRPEDAGLAPAPREALRGGSAAENAAIVEAVLRGERGPRRDVVCLNAAAALVAAGAAPDLRAGVLLAQAAIDDGRAVGRLQALRAFTARRGAAPP